jgi:predicted pyridoxine 5'-phosphate oxidase superfamily flavin-nucleotide-binding protein
MNNEREEFLRYPGSEGERRAQHMFGTGRRAMAFYQNQMMRELNINMQEFIARQEMVFIATADARGTCDCSFRAGTPGFIQILNSTTLAYPEYRGNGVMASVGNILENPQIGLMFVDFTQSTVGLHLNGKAQVITNDDIVRFPHATASLIDEATIGGGRHPECWIVIDVEEAYIHCSKHIPLLKKLDKPIHWGTDDEHLKGGNFFKVDSKKRPYR